MGAEVSDRHFSAQDEGDGSGEEAEDEEWSADYFQEPSKPDERKGDGLVPMHAAECSELLSTVAGKEETGNDA